MTNIYYTTNLYGAAGVYYETANGTAGGTAVSLSGSGVYMIYNSAVIGGGSGGASYYLAGGAGGTGFSLMVSGTLNNSDIIRGGNGGNSVYETSGAGGVGLEVGGAAIVLNSGTIDGGTGGEGWGWDESASGNGGVGVNLGAGTMTNYGHVYGGSGGEGDDEFSNSTGGNGVDIAGGTLTNSGTITGGDSGFGWLFDYDNSAAGVYLDGGTLINSGTISGGFSYYNNSVAVEFGSAVSTLVIDPGAIFGGDVVADASVDDTLQLAGDGSVSTHISGLGSKFTGFTDYAVATGARWTLTGYNHLLAGTSLAVDGTLNVAGRLNDAGDATVAAGGVLRARGNGVVHTHNVSLTGGKLGVDGTGKVVIGDTTALAVTGEIVVGHSGTVSGYGTIFGGPVVDDGSITAENGTLIIRQAVSGTGTLAIGTGGTLIAHGALSVATISFEAGNATLEVLRGAAVTSTIAGFGAGDTIDLNGLHATSMTFADNTLSLYHGTNLQDQITFSGSYTLSDFTLSTTVHGIAVGFQNS